jgi:hypothetical protein
MPPEQRTAAAEAFWDEDEPPDTQVEAIVAIAQRLKFRPKSVAALPRDKKVRYLASTLNVSDAVASRLLVTYHLARQRDMMGQFLDKLGIKHENGLIADEEVPRPDAARLAEAARQLAAEFPTDDASLYFATLVSQDPDTWGTLAEFTSTRA